MIGPVRSQPPWGADWDKWDKWENFPLIPVHPTLSHLRNPLKTNHLSRIEMGYPT
jgi:hypothetical protein